MLLARNLDFQKPRFSSFLSSEDDSVWSHNNSSSSLGVRGQRDGSMDWAQALRPRFDPQCLMALLCSELVIVLVSLPGL